VRTHREGEHKEISMAVVGTGEGPIMAGKKLGGLVLLFLGLLGVAFGFEYDSGAMMAGGLIALVVGMGLLVLKIVRRNPD
jgi:hypothetical protein